MNFSDFRDQGLTRPKVLIVLPFRDAALRVVDMMANLLMTPEQVHLVIYLLFTVVDLVIAHAQIRAHPPGPPYL